MKTLQVFYTEPDAKDSSTSEENEKIPEKPTKNKRFLSQLTIDKSQTPPEKAVEKYPGVRQRPSGRYAAEIKHPISKVMIWLGTFDSAKQAYNAYCLKKLEFDALRNVGICGSYYTIKKAIEMINSKKGVRLRPIVRMTKSGKYYGAWVHPLGNKKIFLGLYDTPKKARDHINRVIAEFEKSIKSKKVDCGVIHGSPTSVLVAENEISESSSIKVKTEVEYESPTSISEQVRVGNSDIGEGKSLDLPLTFDEAVKFGIMNEYGQLLGDYCACDESMWLSDHHVN